MVERAGRSVVDRSLGMGEAAGSIPAQSTRFLIVFPANFYTCIPEGLFRTPMRIRDLILPEDKIFFTLFKEMAEKIAEASTTLNEITHELPDGTEKAHKVRQIEHQGDEITRQIFEQLNESLITPLEPEEISRLAPVMDDVLDNIDWVTQQICNYGIPESMIY